MKKVGIDGGGTLMKIAYEEKGTYHYKKYPMNEMQSALAWLKMIAPTAKVSLTGGKSRMIQEKYFPEATVIPEFKASGEGAVFLLKQETQFVKEPFLLVNIGTGTSWHLINGEKQERILGSGIGGGTFMGLGYLLSNNLRYSQFVSLAGEGNKDNIDLLVKDVYESWESPIDGSLTASNFAKVANNESQSPADLLASLINMIAETIVLLSLQAGTLHQTKKLYFIGSTVSNNSPLKSKLSLYSTMLGLESHFIKNGEYSGAIGAMLFRE
jgi:type II pantothenate kinase